MNSRVVDEIYAVGKLESYRTTIEGILNIIHCDDVGFSLDMMLLSQVFKLPSNMGRILGSV